MAPLFAVTAVNLIRGQLQLSGEGAAGRSVARLRDVFSGERGRCRPAARSCDHRAAQAARRRGEIRMARTVRGQIRHST